MDEVRGRLARRHGCGLCCWFKRTVSGPQVHAYGLCVANPPRTSTTKFPSVMDTDYCGGWTPLVDVREG